ncbi:CDP-diacylglycerol--serine O-phosphatidyltransferase [Magnetovibrio blakemorei]|uniref:CDP-diacylglycerol--serine O-phosphatidyltransferase n=1 Tax=Magnetovibrio blakemorei TaxID=28181 RepID=A0A1E5Q4X3_9PROT|nr:CDP-diacylglycerol--serine O-phosphatidyltransferase [Magnetovibrio blakemorei]OEJ65115.1 CDP-diacylglycerol--serine O-phosphatidyltransferase [Magnetovibrio blakemorei]
MTDVSPALPEHPKRPKRRRLSLNVMIPNMLTLLALSSGLTAIRFAYEGRWEHAALAILAAAILDALDGRIARLLKGTSKFGAELDSLADILSFGVAPPMMLYFWSLKDMGRVGWIVVVLFAVSCALRLARFNTAAEDPNPPAWSSTFFSGVPAPAAAGLALLPMIISFNLFEEYVRRPEVVAVFMVVVALLMVSSIPTYSFKKVKLRPKWVLPLMVTVGLVIASMLSAPWATLSGILAVYLVSIPFAIRSYRTICARTGKCDTQDEDDLDDDETDDL